MSDRGPKAVAVTVALAALLLTALPTAGSAAPLLRADLHHIDLATEPLPIGGDRSIPINVTWAGSNVTSVQFSLQGVPERALLLVTPGGDFFTPGQTLRETFVFRSPRDARDVTFTAVLVMATSESAHLRIPIDVVIGSGSPPQPTAPPDAAPPQPSTPPPLPPPDPVNGSGVAQPSDNSTMKPAGNVTLGGGNETVTAETNATQEANASVSPEPEASADFDPIPEISRTGEPVNLTVRLRNPREAPVFSVEVAGEVSSQGKPVGNLSARGVAFGPGETQEIQLVFTPYDPGRYILRLGVFLDGNEETTIEGIVTADGPSVAPPASGEDHAGFFSGWKLYVSLLVAVMALGGGGYAGYAHARRKRAPSAPPGPTAAAGAAGGTAAGRPLPARAPAAASAVKPGAAAKVPSKGASAGEKKGDGWNIPKDAVIGAEEAKKILSTFEGLRAVVTKATEPSAPKPAPAKASALPKEEIDSRLDSLLDHMSGRMPPAIGPGEHRRPGSPPRSHASDRRTQSPPE